MILLPEIWGAKMAIDYFETPCWVRVSENDTEWPRGRLSASERSVSPEGQSQAKPPGAKPLRTQHLSHRDIPSVSPSCNC